MNISTRQAHDHDRDRVRDYVLEPRPVPSKTGYSISLCIRDICMDRVNLLDVSLIIAGTCARSEEDWERVAASYCHIYWRKFPDEARATLNTLRRAGRIFQPRVVGQNHPGADPIWR
jgi:hypothetical protein